MEPSYGHWKKCSSCKNPIHFATSYWVCNVSTCNRKRTGLAFCSVSCWDAHLPIVRHRESWAEERKAPTPEQWVKIQAGELSLEPKKAADPEETAPAEDQDLQKRPAGTPSSKKVLIRRSTG